VFAVETWPPRGMCLVIDARRKYLPRCNSWFDPYYTLHNRGGCSVYPRRRARRRLHWRAWICRLIFARAFRPYEPGPCTRRSISMFDPLAVDAAVFPGDVHAGDGDGVDRFIPAHSRRWKSRTNAGENGRPMRILFSQQGVNGWRGRSSASTPGNRRR